MHTINDMKILITDIADGVNVASPVYCIDVNKTPPSPTGSNGIKLIDCACHNNKFCNNIGS